MGQGILSSRGGSGTGAETEDPNIVGWTSKTEIITTTQDWTVPKASGQRFQLLMFGGGGGPAACRMYGAGGGYMCKTTVNVTKGSTIRITIGAGGGTSQNGGTTSFGGYASANGGGTPKIVSYKKGDGAAESVAVSGGDGGTGGGAVIYNFVSSVNSLNGYADYNIAKGGDAQYGGGGGGLSVGGKGGIYGGNGGNMTVPAENGTNTMESKYINEPYKGNGGVKNSFSATYHWDDTWSYRSGTNAQYGGGGGYGGMGERGESEGYGEYPDDYFDMFYESAIYCGGGGGWGSQANGPGGGGYGLSRYGAGAWKTEMEFTHSENAKPGVCVITYYEPIWINA